MTWWELIELSLSLPLGVLFLQDGINMDPSAYNEARSRPSLEERLESIISAAALMADADCTRDERRARIVSECNAVRQALQDLLSEYISNVSQANVVVWGRWTDAMKGGRCDKIS